MDLSDIVHGLKPKSRRRRNDDENEQNNSSNQAGPSNQTASSSQAGPSTHTGRGRSNQTISQTNQTRQSHIANPVLNRQQPSSSSSSSPPDGVRAEPVGNSSRSAVKFSCQLCSREFSSQTTFDQHTVVFHGRAKNTQKTREAAFPCPECGKAFTSPSKRNIHQNATHMGIRPFHCNTCSKSFGYKGDLAKHQTTHSGIKPHVCYLCGARFARNFYVKRHIETVHERKKDDSKK